MPTVIDRSYRRRRRRLPVWPVFLAVIVLVTFGGLAVATDALGAGRLFERAVAKVDRMVAGPGQDRATVQTVLVTPRPETVAPSPKRTAAVPTLSSVNGSESTAPMATPVPTHARVPVNVNIVIDPERVFASEVKDTWCSPAAVQMTLAFMGKADTSVGFQRTLQSRIHEWESSSDSHNGLWGPAAMARALKTYGAPGYEVRAYKTRQEALRDAATAIQATGSPVLLLAWRGAHTWVMTGFRANADPAIFPDAKIAGAYILDPWYPRISSIWGASDPPGTYQDRAEMIRNYLVWQRPEGHYPKRDSLFIAVVPTVAVSAGG